jgi:hypothetical protein
MKKQAWTFDRDIKDDVWSTFKTDAEKYLKDQPTDQKVFGEKEVSFAFKSGEQEDKIIINRDSTNGEIEIDDAEEPRIRVTGLLTIASKHFGDALKISGDQQSIDQWKAGIDHASSILGWNQGETINMMASKLGTDK